MATERMAINGIELDVLRRGAGTPVLLLHGMDTVHPQARFLDLLGGDAEIIAPSSPGFGNTKRPADFDTIYDLVHLHLSVLDELPYERVGLLGLSFGGWLAAEVAVAFACHRQVVGEALLHELDHVGRALSVHGHRRGRTLTRSEQTDKREEAALARNLQVQ